MARKKARKRELLIPAPTRGSSVAGRREDSKNPMTKADPCAAT